MKVTNDIDEIKTKFNKQKYLETGYIHLSETYIQTDENAMSDNGWSLHLMKFVGSI